MSTSPLHIPLHLLTDLISVSERTYMIQQWKTCPSSQFAPHHPPNAFPFSPLLEHVHLLLTTGAGTSDSFCYPLTLGSPCHWSFSCLHLRSHIIRHVGLHWNPLCYPQSVSSYFIHGTNESSLHFRYCYSL